MAQNVVSILHRNQTQATTAAVRIGVDSEIQATPHAIDGDGGSVAQQRKGDQDT